MKSRCTPTRNGSGLVIAVLFLSTLFSSTVLGQASCPCESISDMSYGQSDAQYTTIASGVSGQQPYVLILPGILGEKFWDRNIRSGILRGGFSGDVEIYDWTHGALGMPLNIGGNAKQVKYLAERITAFKSQYPNRELHLVGHSGGCRMAINVLEELNGSGASVDKAVLLSPCMDSNYDMRSALAGCNSDIYSFYSPLDVAIPLPLTFAHGMSRGNFAISAAITGFRTPGGLSASEKWDYLGRLKQINYQRHMVATGHPGGHFGWTNPTFVASYIVPLLR